MLHNLLDLSYLGNHLCQFIDLTFHDFIKQFIESSLLSVHALILDKSSQRRSILLEMLVSRVDYKMEEKDDFMRFECLQLGLVGQVEL